MNWITMYYFELNNLLNWITTKYFKLNNLLNWIFIKQFWIEYWIESTLGKIQTLNLGIGQGYVRQHWIWSMLFIFSSIVFALHLSDSHQVTLLLNAILEWIESKTCESQSMVLIEIRQQWSMLLLLFSL